jgi:tetratricopeptide (TPR) repeat protein
VHRALALALCLCAATAVAAPAEMHEHWTRFWAAKLMESADGDIERAARIYDELASLQVANSNDLRIRALLALGEVRKNQGNLQGAQSAYERCRALGASSVAQLNTGTCLEQLRKVLVRKNALRKLPVHWTFDDGTHGFVLFGQNGSIQLTDGTMVWVQTVDDHLPFLVVGFNKLSTPPEGMRMSVRSDKSTANLSLFVHDSFGNLYLEREAFRVGGNLQTIDVQFSNFTPWNESMPPLDPSSIVELQLRDTTKLLQPEANTHNIVLDSFELY